MIFNYIEINDVFHLILGFFFTAERQAGATLAFLFLHLSSQVPRFISVDSLLFPGVPFFHLHFFL